MKDAVQDRTDLLAHLGGGVAARARRAMIEANVGFGPAEADRITRALGPEFTTSLRYDVVPRSSAHQILSAKQIEAQWQEQCAAWLDNRDFGQSVGWSMSLDGGAEHVSGDQLYLPRLPWAKNRCGGVEDTRRRVTGAGSMRGIDIFDPETECVEVNVKRSLPNTSNPGFSMEKLKRVMMWVIWGVERDVDTSLLTRFDALQGLRITARLRAAQDTLPDWLDILEETEAAGDANGGAVIFRKEPRQPEHTALPYFALAHGRSASLNLLPGLASLSGMRQSDYALSAATLYLAGWWALIRSCRVVMTMPHAQNAHLLLDADGRPGRIRFKDLRDMEPWDSYRDIAHHSVRLQGVCAAYLRYEMTVHPIYYDAPLFGAHVLPEMLFNFSFQMLRNHVLRGLEASIDVPEEADRYRAYIPGAIALLAAGAKPQDLPAHDLPADQASAPAIRALRDQFVRELAANA